MEARSFECPTTMHTTSQQITQAAQGLTDVASKLERLCKSSRKKRRGAAVVEFAIVAPLFILLVFGMIEFGRMVMVQQVLTNATREGARQAVLDGSTRDDVEQIINTYLAASSINGATISVNPDPPSNAISGEPVTVSVSVPFGQVSWLPAPMHLGSTVLSASSVMRRESAQ
jgi:Flp pilus assembly protein TadG